MKQQVSPAVVAVIVVVVVVAVGFFFFKGAGVSPTGEPPKKPAGVDEEWSKYSGGKLTGPTTPGAKAPTGR